MTHCNYVSSVESRDKLIRAKVLREEGRELTERIDSSISRPVYQNVNNFTSCTTSGSRVVLISAFVNVSDTLLNVDIMYTATFLVCAGTCRVSSLSLFTDS